MLGFIMLFPLLAQAEDESCWESFQEVNATETWSLTGSETSKIFLPSYNMNGPFLTKAAAHFDRNENQIQVYFDFELNKMSLPYNIFRLELTIGPEGAAESYQYTIDFTKNCTAPGIALFPRGSIYLPVTEVPAFAKELLNRGVPVQIKIWGHL